MPRIGLALINAYCLLCLNAGIMGALTVLGASSGFGAFSFFLTVDSGYLFYAMVVLVAVAISCFTMSEAQLAVTPENSMYVRIYLCRDCHGVVGAVVSSS